MFSGLLLLPAAALRQGRSLGPQVLEMLDLAPELMAVLTKHKEEGKIHVDFLGGLHPERLQQRLDGSSDWTHILAFRPTGKSPLQRPSRGLLEAFTELWQLPFGAPPQRLHRASGRPHRVSGEPILATLPRPSRGPSSAAAEHTAWERAACCTGERAGSLARATAPLERCRW